jgi:hypothetical protein
MQFAKGLFMTGKTITDLKVGLIIDKNILLIFANGKIKEKRNQNGP